MIHSQGHCKEECDNDKGDCNASPSDKKGKQRYAEQTKDKNHTFEPYVKSQIYKKTFIGFPFLLVSELTVVSNPFSVC